MCGRFTATASPGLVAERFSVDVPELHRERYNVAPTQTILAVCQGESGREARMMRWGLVPRWAKDISVGSRMINARAETLSEKRTYRSLLSKNRCLIPADGFYEWRVGADGKKEPIRFTLADGSLFGLAGLWTTWLNRETGELADSCTIVTTQPNSLVAPVHNRMPVILEASDEDVWLNSVTDVEEAMGLLRPYPPSAMSQHVASRAVNAASNDSPEILRPGLDSVQAA